MENKPRQENQLENNKKVEYLKEPKMYLKKRKSNN